MINSNITLLREHFLNNGINSLNPATILQVEAFQERYNVVLPADILNYYTYLNGSGNEPLNDLYEFYDLERTKPIKENYKNWKGIPDYQNLDFFGMDRIFIFANYEFNFFSFGIELYERKIHKKNKVYILCGHEYKIIADSFDDFIELYLREPEEIYI